MIAEVEFPGRTALKGGQAARFDTGMTFRP